MRALHGGPINALEPPHFTFFLGDRRCGIGVKHSGFGLGDVAVGQSCHHKRLFAPVWTAQLNYVADTNRTPRLAALAVHFDFAALAGSLRLGPRFIETRHVQPHIQPDGGIVLSHC